MGGPPGPVDFARTRTVVFPHLATARHHPHPNLGPPPGGHPRSFGVYAPAALSPGAEPPGGLQLQELPPGHHRSVGAFVALEVGAVQEPALRTDVLPLAPRHAGRDDAELRPVPRADDVREPGLQRHSRREPRGRDLRLLPHGRGAGSVDRQSTPRAGPLEVSWFDPDSDADPFASV